MNDAVRVDHRNQLEDVGLSEEERLFAVRVRQVVRQPLHDKGAGRFSWVLPRRDEDHLSLILFALVVVRDGQKVAVVPGQRLAERVPSDELLPPLVAAEPGQVDLQVRVRVRVAVREENRIRGVLERVAEAERVVVLRRVRLLLNPVLLVGNVERASVPPQLSLPLREARRTHPVVEQRVILHQVDDVKLVCAVFFGVCDREVKSLRIPL